MEREREDVNFVSYHKSGYFMTSSLVVIMLLNVYNNSSGKERAERKRKKGKPKHQPIHRCSLNNKLL